MWRGLKGSELGTKNKEHVQQVQENEDTAGPQAQMLQIGVAMLERAKDGKVEHGGHDQSGHRDHQHGAVHGGSAAGKALYGMMDAAHHQAEAKHQQKIPDDASGERCLDHVDMSRAQGKK